MKFKCFSRNFSIDFPIILKLCYGTGLGDIIPCPEDKEYCQISTDGDSCSARLPDECRPPGSGSTEFQCTDYGYFPNVANCSEFYFCGLNEDATGFEVTTIPCPVGNVFDPNAASFCTRQSIFNNCVKFECPDVTAATYSQITYGTNRQYYALCVPTGAPKNPRIFSCPSNTQPNLTKLPAKCDYRCLRAGVFENTSDKTKYFECFLNNQLRLESAERTCPPRSEFVVSKSRCVAAVRTLGASIEGFE